MTKTLEFRWSVSRGRDTYGYNICSLYVDGRKVASCNGGGCDMKGTALGDYIARAYADRLLALPVEAFPEQSHWERNPTPLRICEDIQCAIDHAKEGEIEYHAHDVETCPHCGKPTRVDRQSGRTVDDGRYFYGLTFHDPNYDPGKAKIGADCSDRTLGDGAEGKTVEQAEADGVSLGLERYQAFYSASSKLPTERHNVPLIDGGCGFSSVEQIAKAIGVTLEYIPTRGKTSVYQLRD